MLSEQEVYILECSKKYKSNITLTGLVFEIFNPNICRFQGLENILIRITFAVQCFNCKIPIDTPVNYFFPENAQADRN